MTTKLAVILFVASIFIVGCEDGERGVMGITGPSGIDGTNGANGNDGLKGADGAVGHPDAGYHYDVMDGAGHVTQCRDGYHIKIPGVCVDTNGCTVAQMFNGTICIPKMSSSLGWLL